VVPHELGGTLLFAGNIEFKKPTQSSAEQCWIERKGEEKEDTEQSGSLFIREDFPRLPHARNGEKVSLSREIAKHDPSRRWWEDAGTPKSSVLAQTPRHLRGGK